MTVSTTTNEVSYDGTGGLAAWPVPFRFFDDTDLTVTKIDAQDNSTVLVLGADYTVTGAGDLEGGTVTPAAALPVGQKVIITRILAAVQETDLRNQGRFFAQIHEDVFDYLTMLVQQSFSWLSRALVRPIGKSYYDAEGRRIANVGDPQADGDATNKGWVVTYTAYWYRAAIEYAEKLLAGATGGFGYFIQLGAGAEARTFQSKLREIHQSPFDYGAVGDGVANDTAAYALAEAAADVVRLPKGAVFVIDPGYVFTKPTSGPGQVKIGGVALAGADLVYDVYRSSLQMIPDSYAGQVGSPTAGDNLSISISPGGKHTGVRNRSTFVGTLGPKQIQSVDRIDGFGNGTFMYTRFLERTAALGTIACQWLGSNNPLADNHEWWTNAGGYVPGQVGWNYQGMETRNPGIGAKIAAFTGFATQPTDCGRSVAVGRNALNGTVMATNVVAVGYRAAAGTYSVSNLVALGTDSFRDGVFHKDSVAAGSFAGNAWQEGERNALFGHNAGGSAVRGTRNTLMGSFAGYDYTDLNGCILIGHGAGNTIGGSSLTNVFCLGPDGTLPLMSGRLNDFALGVNILPARIKATLHVRTNDFGAEAAAHTLADELVLENSVGCGMTIRSPSDASGNIFFADPGSTSAGGMSYTHSSDTLALLANGASRYQVDSAALFPTQDNAYSIGKASFRPSVIYAATGSISTSDGRLKEVRGLLNDADLKAWSGVQPLIYQFIDMVEEKGKDHARLHAGYVAQEVQRAFLDAGLDPTRYALWCEDPVYRVETRQRSVERQVTQLVAEERRTIELIDGVATQIVSTVQTQKPVFRDMPVFDQSGAPVERDGEQLTFSIPVMEVVQEDYEVQVQNGTRLGLRYDQCLVFEVAYLRSLVAKQDERIRLLEEK
ncbi:tail fiber domain-containing protein [Pseudomonas alloputida]|uniref:tail fiber domain-containing protein n=1 Tax=Pseudomonas alloputida TaxID=1940621 RepID=UPI003B42B260